jgi:hypothetical protein
MPSERLAARESEPAAPAEYAVTLDAAVPAGLGDEIARRLYYVSPLIVGYQLIGDRSGIGAVQISVAGRDDGRLPEIADKVRRMVATEVATQLPMRQQVVWRSARDAAARPARPVFDDMVAAGLAVRCGPGQVALAQPVLALLDRLDAMLRDIAVTGFGAREFRYPTLLPTAQLRRSGYLGSFPQHVMFATRLHADLDTYHDFVRALESDGLSVLGYCEDAELCLPPTMCYHTFHQLSGAALAGNTVVTARGRSFRHESRYHADLERLWDFTIREIVFVGSRGFVAECREAFLARATDLLDRLDLAGRCELAHDPFFGGPKGGPSVSSQRMLALKYEARLAVAADRTIAVGSFNLHDQHFGDAFQITGEDGRAAYSACVGFGLERLCYAVLCQHGLDPGGWPAPLDSDRAVTHGGVA